MKVHLSEHCIARYHERVRPGVELAQAKRELQVLVTDCPP